MSLNLAELLDDWSSRIEQYGNAKTPYSILLEGSKSISKVDYFLLSKENQSKYAVCVKSLLNHPECDQEIYNNLKTCTSFESLTESVNSVYNHSVQEKIVQNVKAYIFQFFKSIESVMDPELHVSAYNSMFLSGGALFGEINKNVVYPTGFSLGQVRIKDYDFYFTNKIVAGEFVTFLLSNFTDIINPEKKLSVKGSFEGLSIVGIDNSYCDGIFKFGKTEFMGGISQNAITIRMPGVPDLQFIIKHIGDPSVVVSNFDFMHSTHFLTLSDNKISFNKVGIQSIKRASLQYSPLSGKSLSSFFRMQYYITQGWKISKYESIKILFNLLGADLTDKDFLVANLSGMYREKAIKALDKYKDVKKLNSEQVMDIIKIFDWNDEVDLGQISEEEPIF